jgi:hypothetical protein
VSRAYMEEIVKRADVLVQWCDSICGGLPSRFEGICVAARASYLAVTSPPQGVVCIFPRYYSLNLRKRIHRRVYNA